MITNTGTRRCCFLAVFMALMIGVYGDIVIKHVEREVCDCFLSAGVINLENDTLKWMFSSSLAESACLLLYRLICRSVVCQRN